MIFGCYSCILIPNQRSNQRSSNMHDQNGAVKTSQGLKFNFLINVSKDNMKKTVINVEDLNFPNFHECYLILIWVVL